MSNPTIIAELVKKHARELKMPALARQFDPLAREARKESWSFEEYLQELLSTEITSRHESAVRQRMSEARFPEPKTLDTFDFDQADGIESSQILELSRCTWVDRAENLVLAGPIGTGKTHLAIALGIEAVRLRKRVAFYRAADLVRMMIEARDARELGRLQRRLDRVDVLVLDELGFVPFDRHGGELLFHVIADRYERHSVVVTTNLAFSEWPKVFGDDEKLTTALLDRLAHHATVITPRGKSYRMKKRSQQREPGAPPSDLADQAPAKSPRKR